MSAIWEWGDDKGTFTSFDKKITEKLEAAFAPGGYFTPVSVSIRGTAYELNLVAFYQKNLTSGKCRTIRRRDSADGSVTVCGTTWECYVGDTHWEAYAPEVSKSIEVAHTNGDLKVDVTLVGRPKIHGMPVTVHFGHMQQVSGETKVAHKVRRVSKPAVTVISIPPPEVKKRSREVVEEDAPASWARVDGTLLVRTCPGVKPSAKIAGFDLDDTLITTKSGNIFAKNADDWKFLCPEVPAKLAELVRNGFHVVIFSNQAGIGKGKVWETEKASVIMKKIDNVLASVGLEKGVQAILACSEDKYRKPSTQMWKHVMIAMSGGLPISLTESFYVGDAAGRPGLNLANRADFSCSDRIFGYNVGVPFFTPEEFFQGKPPATFTWSPFDPTKVGTAPAVVVPPPLGGTEAILMVGFPGSGKSTIAKQYVARHGFTHINRDTLKTSEKCVKMFGEALAKGQSVVVDNTSPQAADRLKYISIASRLGITIRCIWVTTPEAMAKHLNMFRNNFVTGAMVPGIAFNMYKSKFQEPQLSEGLAAVIRIDFAPSFDHLPAGAKQMFLETPAV